MNHEKYIPQQDVEKKRTFQDFESMLASGEAPQEIDPYFIEQFKREDRERVVEALLSHMTTDFKQQVAKARSKINEPRKDLSFRSKPALLKTNKLVDLKNHDELNFPRIYQIIKEQVHEAQPAFEEYNKDIAPQLEIKGYIYPFIERAPFDTVVIPALTLYDQFQVPVEDYLPIAQYAMRYGYVESVFTNSEIFKRIPKDHKQEFINELIGGTAEGPFKGERHFTKIVSRLLFPARFFGRVDDDEVESCNERRRNFQEYIGQLLLSVLHDNDGGRETLQRFIAQEEDSFQELLTMIKNPAERQEIIELLKKVPDSSVE